MLCCFAKFGQGPFIHLIFIYLFIYSFLTQVYFTCMTTALVCRPYWWVWVHNDYNKAFKEYRHLACYSSQVDNGMVMLSLRRGCAQNGGSSQEAYCELQAAIYEWLSKRFTVGCSHNNLLEWYFLFPHFCMRAECKLWPGLRSEGFAIHLCMWYRVPFWQSVNKWNSGELPTYLKSMEVSLSTISPADRALRTCVALPFSRGFRLQ